MSTMEVILSTMGDVQYRRRYHNARGGYHENRGVFSTMGGYHPLKFEYRGEYHDAYGGYHEYCGGVHYHGVLK